MGEKNKSLEIRIQSAKCMKTNKQLAYYHLLINLVVKETKTPKDNLIIQIKNQLGYYKEYFIQGEVLKEFLSMADAKRDEATEFVKAGQELCDYLEIIYPKPDEFYKSIGADK